MSAPFGRFQITYFRGEQNNVYIIFLKIKISILFYNIFPRNAILWNRSLNFRFAARKKKKKNTYEKPLFSERRAENRVVFSGD